MASRLHLGILALLTLIWGTTWAAIRIGLKGVPPLTGAALRFALASLVLLAVVRALKVRLGRSAVERRLWVASGLLNFAISYGLVYWAEQYLPSGLAAVIFASFPLFVAVLAHFFLPGERLSAAGAVGVVLGFAGIVILFSEDLTAIGGPNAVLAAAVLPLAPFAASIGQVVIKRWGAGVHPLSLAAVPMGLCSLVLGTLALVLERGRPVVLDAASIGSILYLALVGSALAFSLYFFLLTKRPATWVALVAYTSPAVAVLVGVVVLDEPFTLRLVLGTVAVLGGVLLSVRAHGRAGRG